MQSTSLQAGVVTVFVPGATGAVTTIEFEDGLVEDLGEALQMVGEYNCLFQYYATIITVGRPRPCKSSCTKTLRLPSLSTRVKFCRCHSPVSLLGGRSICAP